ncbi:MAG: SBBP repeat-containing protein, partial [Verrucomicrobia bacterium]|nr:SBBP repeat-containing protein [Verrucomicrobiota bacterium]
PAISTQPQSQTNRVNTFVSFFVSANGFSPLTYQWRKNGALLLGETNNSFAIFSSRVADSGGYSVVVSNPGGSVTSVVATLTVVLRTNLFSAADVVWIRQAGGTNDDRGQAVAVDPSGNVFVAGTFGDTFGQRLSTDTGSFGTNTLPANGRKQFFVAKLNPAGSVLWVRTATGTAEHEASTVTTDASGNVFVGGVFNGAALFGANSLASSGTEDAFLTKLDGAGNFLWATQAGRTNAGFGATTVQTDANGNAYWAGMFQGRLNLGTNSLASAGGYDIFLALVNRSGAVQWAKNYGGTNDDAAWSLSLQPGTTNVYLSGNFRSATTLGPTNLTGTGFNTAFLARLTGDGNVVWALASGGNGFDESLGVVADAAGNAYLTGSTTSTNFAVGALSITNLSGGCAYLLKANSGGAPQWLRKLNESGGGQSLALDAGGNPIVAGWLNLPVTYDQEIFLARLDPFGSPLGVAIAGGAGPDAANGVAVATDGSIYVTGFFQAAGIGGATFGPNAVGGLGNSDIFIAKLSGVPHRPVRIHTLAQQAGAAARLVFGHDDHSPLDINRRPRMKVLATGDLNIPRANWQQLTNTVLNADGELQLDDAGAFVTPRRFYLISDGP